MKPITIVVTSMLLLCGAALPCNVYAADATQGSRIEIMGVVNNDSLKSKMEQNVSALINEFDDAYNQNRDLDLSHIDIVPQTRADIERLWQNMHFICIESQIISRGVNLGNEYKIRHLMFQTDVKTKGRNGVISLNTEGEITSFHFAVDYSMWYELTMQNQSPSEIRKVACLFDFIERLQLAYHTQDIDYISNTFSGVLTMAMNSDGRRVISDDGAQTHLESIKYAFQRNYGARVDFNDIYILRHPVRENIFGVTLLQDFDVEDTITKGWVLLAIQISDDYTPKVHVKTWQPYIVDGKIVSRKDVFQLGLFEL